MTEKLLAEHQGAENDGCNQVLLKQIAYLVRDNRDRTNNILEIYQKFAFFIVPATRAASPVMKLHVFLIVLTYYGHAGHTCYTAPSIAAGRSYRVRRVLRRSTTSK